MSQAETHLTALSPGGASLDDPGPGGPAGARPRWVRPALAGLLLATAALYLWGLHRSGWANAFYSAAAQAGSRSWTAFFYGSSDAANSITVDKTPASLWLMALSVRLFGLNSWAILVPQALAGVASVGVLYATVRRWYGPAAGLLAGAALALTPVATLMFRFNNPDALLVLLLLLGAYATVRAVETASTRWIVLAGVCVGFGFLTKMLQAFLVVPVFAGIYLLAAPAGVGRRVRQLLLAGLAMVVSAGWWVAIVELVPAESRPYIGGSQTNSILELTLGYNGLGRITGDEAGSVGGRNGWGETGWQRLFGADIGGQVAWLLPAALILLVAGLVITRRAARTDPARAGFLLWGGWLLVTGITFSCMQGIFHAYYTVALAPAIAALVGMGTAVLWQRRHDRAALATLAGTIGVTAGWSWVLLGRSPDWQPRLRPTVLVAGLAAAGLLVLVGRRGWPRWAVVAVLTLGALAALAGPLGYSLETVAAAHTGALPTAGPAVVGAGFGGPGRPGRAAGQFPGGGPGGGQLPGAGQLPGGGPGAGQFPGGGGQLPGAGQLPGGGQLPGDGQRGAGQARGAPGFAGPGMGGLLHAGTPGDELVALLLTDAEDYTWVAAAVGSNSAAGYQLATEYPVMAVGGFNGSDPSPTLEQFQQHVRNGDIHYFLGGSGFAANGGSRTAQEIAAWVTGNFTPTTVDGVAVYDLSTGVER